MDGKRRGDGGRSLREVARDPQAFERCGRRLERAIASSCGLDRPWPDRVAAGIRATLEFAEAEPVAARVVMVHAASRRYGGSVPFTAMVDGLAARMAEGAPPIRYPERTARNVVLRVMRQTLLQIELLRQPPTAIAPDLIVFALTPYVGLAEAQERAARPSSG